MTPLHPGIPVEREDPEGDPLENCCFCRVETPFWTVLPDRQPGGQVACCEACARLYAPVEVPGKSEWCDADARAAGVWV